MNVLKYFSNYLRCLIFYNNIKHTNRICKFSNLNMKSFLTHQQIFSTVLAILKNTNCYDLHPLCFIPNIFLPLQSIFIRYLNKSWFDFDEVDSIFNLQYRLVLSGIIKLKFLGIYYLFKDQ